MGALLVVSDELFDLRWKHGFTRPRFLNACRYACRLAVKAALLLSGEEGPEAKVPQEEEVEEGTDNPWEDDNFPLQENDEDSGGDPWT